MCVCVFPEIFEFLYDIYSSSFFYIIILVVRGSRHKTFLYHTCTHVCATPKMVIYNMNQFWDSRCCHEKQKDCLLAFYCSIYIRRCRITISNMSSLIRISAFSDGMKHYKTFFLYLKCCDICLCQNMYILSYVWVCVWGKGNECQF